MPQTITYQNSTLSFETYGIGKELLLAFHGYGKDASSLKVLEEYCGNRFTIVSIDIFYHGYSTWKNGQEPTQKHWKEIITLLLQRLNCSEKFSVFGYSIGGQLATCTAWLFQERINILWLMAATGIGNDGWYHLAVNTQVGNLLFKRFVNSPGFISTPLKWLTNLGVFTQAYKAFIERKIDTKEKRDLLYKRWMVLRNFGVYTNKLKKALNTNNCSVILVYGKTDQVVKYKAGRRFAKNISNVNLLLPNEGHHLLTDAVLSETAEYLKT